MILLSDNLNRSKTVLTNMTLIVRLQQGAKEPWSEFCLSNDSPPVPQAGCAMQSRR